MRRKLKNTKPKPKVKTTGYKWDGIEEYDNPDPLWLRYLFYAAVIFTLIYWLLYPSWPTPDNEGLLHWSSYKQLQTQLKELETVRAEYQESFDKATFEEIMQDERLYKFALVGGESAFNNNCAVCHQQGGVGAPGYPNLTDDEWLWGGSIDDIYTTIRYGIRSGHEEARDSQMAAFGQDNILTSEQIKLLAKYVYGLHSNADFTPEAHESFIKNCASCHGQDGEGNREFGAPRLNGATWLYGGDLETIYNSIYNGRQGVMPYWEGKLSDSTIRQITLYVHSLGGGE